MFTQQRGMTAIKWRSERQPRGFPGAAEKPVRQTVHAAFKFVGKDGIDLRPLNAWNFPCSLPTGRRGT